MNTKTKSTTSKILLIALALVMVLGALVALPITSSAATNRAGVYTISGTYNIGDGNVSGYMSNFRITIATQYFTDDSAKEVMLGENIGVTVDGEAFVGSVYNTEGKHVMVISDSYGVVLSMM